MNPHSHSGIGTVLLAKGWHLLLRDPVIQCYAPKVSLLKTLLARSGKYPDPLS